jgi:hypothetical protein
MLKVVMAADAVRIGQRFAVTFQRTLRIPDDGRAYPLPPGLGRLPVLNVADYSARAPFSWRQRGGAFIPMYQREALWLGFHGAHWKPNAVKVAVGGFNAISGEPDDVRLRTGPQDYLVCPAQPWLDGIHSGTGSVRQFVAMPLGEGYTVEASLRGDETQGGIQITVFDPKPGRFPEQPPPPARHTGPARAAAPATSRSPEMGLGAGGILKQRIYPDPYGIDTWDQDNFGRVLVHIVNSAQFLDITGIAPPPTPIDASVYAKHGLPWFDLYDEGRGDVAPSKSLTEVKTIEERDAERGAPQPQDSLEITEEQIVKLRRGDAGEGVKDDPSQPGSSREHR